MEMEFKDFPKKSVVQEMKAMNRRMDQLSEPLT